MFKFIKNFLWRKKINKDIISFDKDLKKMSAVIIDTGLYFIDQKNISDLRIFFANPRINRIYDEESNLDKKEENFLIKDLYLYDCEGIKINPKNFLYSREWVKSKWHIIKIVDREDIPNLFNKIVKIKTWNKFEIIIFSNELNENKKGFDKCQAFFNKIKNLPEKKKKEHAEYFLKNTFFNDKNSWKYENKNIRNLIISNLIYNIEKYEKLIKLLEKKINYKKNETTH